MNEKKIDYTNCFVGGKGPKTCAQAIEEQPGSKCECVLEFDLAKNFDRDVFVYYSLTNYYQNHRRYVKSRDDKQLLGFREYPSADCYPFQYKEVENKTSNRTERRAIAPCGAIANSLFNDTFEIGWFNTSRSKFSPVPLLQTGIAWATDKGAKFRNPKGKTLQDAFRGYEKPFNWQKSVWELDSSTESNNGYMNEAFIVWMRTAALPTFRKLYARIKHSSDPDYHKHLPKGKYRVTITYSEFAIGNICSVIFNFPDLQTILWCLLREPRRW